MSYVGKEQIQKAKEVDLISYLKAYEPDELVHISGENYCTKTVMVNGIGSLVELVAKLH